MLAAALSFDAAAGGALGAYASSGRHVSFSDISGEKCAEAVMELASLGVVNGYDDGTFRPGRNVTRAEMAQLAANALNAELDPELTSTDLFSDMKEAAWAVPAVEYCSGIDVINGFKDGTFKPNDPVTYQQAATMIVRAVGYTDSYTELQEREWPENYEEMAGKLGIFNDIENKGAAAANRGDICIMLKNAVTLPLVTVSRTGKISYVSGDELFEDEDGDEFSGQSMMTDLLGSELGSGYAMVMDYEIYYENGRARSGVIVNSSGLGGDESAIQVMDEDGIVKVLKIKNNTRIVDDRDRAYTYGIGIADIITYDEDEDGNIVKLMVQETAGADISDRTFPYTETHRVSASGSYDYYTISEDSVIFTVEGLTIHKDWSRDSDYPKYYIEEADAAVIDREKVLDTADVSSYAYYVRGGDVLAMVIDGNTEINSEDLFGTMTSWAQVDPESSEGSEYRVTALINGEERTYYYDADVSKLDRRVFYRFIVNAKGHIIDVYSITDSKRYFGGSLLGFAESGYPIKVDGRSYNENGVNIRKGFAAVDSRKLVEVDTDAVYLVWDENENAFVLSDRSDIDSADDGLYALFINTDYNGDEYIANVVALMDARTASYNGI